LKANIFAFTYIWVRATLPRVRYDKLINLCWMIFLPILFGAAIGIPTWIYMIDGIMI
jgi:NADH-ubiquinone oxidoreductase chain 1